MNVQLIWGRPAPFVTYYMVVERAKERTAENFSSPKKDNAAHWKL